MKCYIIHQPSAAPFSPPPSLSLFLSLSLSLSVFHSVSCSLARAARRFRSLLSRYRCRISDQWKNFLVKKLRYRHRDIDVALPISKILFTASRTLSIFHLNNIARHLPCLQFYLRAERAPANAPRREKRRARDPAHPLLLSPPGLPPAGPKRISHFMSILSTLFSRPRARARQLCRTLLPSG